jgi:hypothetical protein
MQSPRSVAARWPDAHPRFYDRSERAVNVPPSPPPPPDALERLAAAGIAEARAIVGVIALHATRDPAALALLKRHAAALRELAAEVDHAAA